MVAASARLTLAASTKHSVVTTRLAMLPPGGRVLSDVDGPPQPNPVDSVHRLHGIAVHGRDRRHSRPAAARTGRHPTASRGRIRVAETTSATARSAASGYHADHDERRKAHERDAGGVVRSEEILVDLVPKLGGWGRNRPILTGCGLVQPAAGRGLSLRTAV